MKKYKSEFIPEFKKNYLSPVYWSTWFLLGMIAGISMFPPSFRDPVLAKIGRWAGRLSKKARRRATINLSLCFPEKSDTEREIIVDKMFVTALQSIVMMAELAIRGPEKFQKRVFWKGLEILEEIRHNNRNVIFLVPHGWSVDIPAMLLAAQGKKMAAMFHQQRNPVIDYVWNSVRRKFGGRLHAREDGIKPFIQSVRQGYWGYYLPDQDHGPEYSEFADFFATYKATLPIIGRLMNISQAMIIPLFPVYDEKKHLLTIEIRPPMDACIASADNKTIARQMNKTVEILVGPHPEQYVWVLKLLKTRKSNEADPYP
ncbi:lipid A biosynthesis (KDO)2-(lauroyl)-lipid IVA acyltransferase [Shigella flexneri]|jgi:lauroyl-KDO2-lipid IV(A) myristoyltransferase|uniref:Lipid A biosynthesis myristoyltransferase n=30 Tax=Enterobacteriaceae TaxID=543 RepID=A0A0K5B5F0_ECOLX|nr:MULTISPECIES: lauroyl-Kdo(2)-lipid IV(A) myristoyltransferase [Enterobacteriaceae]EEY7948636.1 lauroyl-Kdo(2)-lipid IV(A) myristoyltransferase [Escherichia coli H30]EFW0986178.1 lauroyl-Kdo(2)-lipid IV(A) myristoyltransferase [Shigella boydii]EHU57153.1 lipid A biosynthesis (KDO)2-(lauroyl)-lipid IVA acyltransferase [Escherichia coli DEC2E]EKG0291552.1 lauroyl-Kdo(2)-lipid IV(A) myristoyltransferase [Escherichia albertii]RDZ21862.1 lauroyl-Kdo(2)-lipid IV(A) myristoyltransferase [Enterobact